MSEDFQCETVWQILDRNQRSRKLSPWIPKIYKTYLITPKQVNVTSGTAGTCNEKSAEFPDALILHRYSLIKWSWLLAVVVVRKVVFFVLTVTNNGIFSQLTCQSYWCLPLADTLRCLTSPFVNTALKLFFQVFIAVYN